MPDNTQGKRPRLSKETVDSDDEDINAFLADSIADPCPDCGPNSEHTFEDCPVLPSLLTTTVSPLAPVLFHPFTNLAAPLGACQQ